MIRAEWLLVVLLLILCWLLSERGRREARRESAFFQNELRMCQEKYEEWGKVGDLARRIKALGSRHYVAEELVTEMVDLAGELEDKRYQSPAE